MRTIARMVMLAGFFLFAAPGLALMWPGNARPARSSSSPQLVAIIPVVISSPGQLGSLFKTELQVHNAEDRDFKFRAVFHPAGVPGSTNDPFLDVTVMAGTTIWFPDLLRAMGQSGIGSVDILALSDPGRGAATIRVFNDGGAAGTSGFMEPFLDEAEYLYPGTQAILIGPAQPTRLRFNVGVRTMDEGASVSISATDGGGDFSGWDVKEFTRSYPPNYFEQTDVATFLGGVAVPGNATISVRVLSGGLYVYGVSADNVTNDPGMQVPERMEPD